MLKRNLIITILLATLTVANVFAHEEGADPRAEANKILTDLKAQIAPDSRTAIWNVNATLQSGVLTIYGTVDSSENYDAIEKAFNDKGIKIQNYVIVLEETESHGWGMVKLAIATLRTEGRHAAEAATQAIMGTPVRILENNGDWCRVKTPDGYISYVPTNSLRLMCEKCLAKWHAAKRYIVTTYQTRLVDAPKSDATVTDLVMGCILEYKGTELKGKWLKLATPDGREGYIEASEVADFEKWAKQDFNAAQIEKTARRMLGSGYLWGGTTTKVTDCSGLAKISYFSNGIILQRDASQQALTGKKIAATDWKLAECGDLLFFGSNSGKVTHVGIYLRDGVYIHCSGQVKINSVDPNAEGYLTTPFLSISRINGEIGTKGITYVRDHNWYFKK